MCGVSGYSFQIHLFFCLGTVADPGYTVPDNHSIVRFLLVSQNSLFPLTIVLLSQLLFSRDRDQVIILLFFKTKNTDKTSFIMQSKLCLVIQVMGAMY